MTQKEISEIQNKIKVLEEKGPDNYSYNEYCVKMDELKMLLKEAKEGKK